MQNNKEIIKYIVSSIWSSWNPINWSPSMQLATLSYILSCLIDGNDAYPIEDAQIINNDQKWLKSNQTYTFFIIPNFHLLVIWNLQKRYLSIYA